MKYPIAYPYFPEEDAESIGEAVKDILRGKGMLTMGEHVAAFEREFAARHGVPHAVGCNSCTGALEIALRALGVGPGDEVVVPVQTFVATGSAVAVTGATPVFCEVDADFVLDVEDLQRRMTSRTKAVIVVHFAGLTHPRIAEIRDLCDQSGVFLVEDAAHAPGASQNGRCAGSFGHVGCFSFFSTKVMTTGEGGMMTTSDPELARILSSLRNRGLDVGAPSEIFVNLGSNRRMSEFQALLGRAQLARLDSFIAHRNVLAETYRTILADLESAGRVGFQAVPRDGLHAYWRFVVLLPEGADREALQQAMAEEGIRVDWPYSPLLHRQPVFRGYCGDIARPVSEALAARHVCLPMHMLISTADAEFIAGRLRGWLA